MHIARDALFLHLQRPLEVLERRARRIAVDVNAYLEVGAHGRLLGLHRCLNALCDKNTIQSFEKEWTEMLEHGLIHSEFRSESHLIQDLFYVLVEIDRFRREKYNNRRPSMRRYRALIKPPRNALLHWIAGGIDEYITAIYCKSYDTSSPPPL